MRITGYALSIGIPTRVRYVSTALDCTDYFNYIAILQAFYVTYKYFRLFNIEFIVIMNYIFAVIPFVNIQRHQPRDTWI